MSELCNSSRGRVLEFLIHCAHELEVSPMVKYSALALFAERFHPAISRHLVNKATGNWLLYPMTESNLQLFAISALWISSKMHDSPPMSVKHFKNLADKFIREQHFTSRDLLEAEVVLMQVLEFKIGTLNIAFIFLEELLVQLIGVAQVGKYIKLENCMDILDLLYEEEEKMVLYSSPFSLAASLLSLTDCCLRGYCTKTKVGVPYSSLGEVCEWVQGRRHLDLCWTYTEACVPILKAPSSKGLLKPVHKQERRKTENDLGGSLVWGDLVPFPYVKLCPGLATATGVQ